MSPPLVHVRARDGALYRNPLWIFPEGFVCFDDEEPPEIVLWIELDEENGADPVDQDGILRRVFGFGPSSSACSAEVGTLAYAGRCLRVIPNSEPAEHRAAVSFFFEVSGRPPRPTTAGGSERHASRLQGKVYDWPPGALDATALEIP